MKKLFSIALVIAMAISCLAIFPSAALGEGSSLEFVYSFDGDILTLSAIADVQWLDDEERLDYGVMDFFMSYDPAALEYIEDSVTFTGAASANDEIVMYAGDGMFGTGIANVPYDADGKAAPSISIKFKVLVAPGETFVLSDEASVVACGDNFTYFEGEEWVENGMEWGDRMGYDITITYPAATEDPEDTTTETKPVEPEVPTYEAPAAAEYQTLAGCELCETPAGVRFIATVDADADAFGMYISANGTTKKLSSTDAGFKVKAETADTITFTAVIFSDLKFTVEVFEVYGETEVKSVAGTN